MARVSVIVPVYNSEAFLGDCVESLLAQTHRDLEILLVDDGSTDASGRMCDEYAGRDPRVRVMHAANRGPSAARNLGIQAAGGEFLYFMDSDDMVQPRAIAALLERYEQQPADLIIGNFVTAKGGVSGPGHKGVPAGDRLMPREELVAQARSYLEHPTKFTLFGYSWGRLFRADIVRDNNVRFDEELFTYEDVKFNYEYLRRAGGAWYLCEPLYTHTVHDGYESATMSLAGNPNRMFGYEKAIMAIEEYLTGAGAGAALAQAAGHAYVTLTIVQFVRICGQMNARNRRFIYGLIKERVHGRMLQSRLKHYAPSGSDSRMVPFLMRLRLTWPVIWVCVRKSRKRYGKVKRA